MHGHLVKRPVQTNRCQQQAHRLRPRRL